jgi:hypothetical protein
MSLLLEFDIVENKDSGCIKDAGISGDTPASETRGRFVDFTSRNLPQIWH